MMTTRILAVAAVTLALGSAPANAQGRSPQQVVVSPSVLKSIAAQKQKSKTPLMTRVGVRRAPASTVVNMGSTHPQATVREVKKVPITK